MWSEFKGLSPGQTNAALKQEPEGPPARQESHEHFGPASWQELHVLAVLPSSAALPDQVWLLFENTAGTPWNQTLLLHFYLYRFSGALCVLGMENQDCNLPYHTIPYHTVPYHTIPYRTVPYRTVPYRTIPYHTIPYHTIPYHTIPYHTIPYHTIPYHTIPYHTIPYHTIPYHTIPYHTIPYIPYHTIPYHTIPYHTIPYHTLHSS